MPADGGAEDEEDEDEMTAGWALMKLGSKQVASSKAGGDESSQDGNEDDEGDEGDEDEERSDQEEDEEEDEESQEEDGVEEEDDMCGGSQRAPSSPARRPRECHAGARLGACAWRACGQLGRSLQLWARRYGEEDENEDMLRLVGKEQEPSMLMQMAAMAGGGKAGAKVATHRRGVPSSIRPARSQHVAQAQAAADHTKQMHMWQQQVREQTRMVDASSIVLGASSTADDGAASAAARGGAQRRRKQPYPEPSLLPMF